MQLFIHDDDEVALALAADHRVASVNPTNLLARYASGVLQPDNLTVPGDAMVVTVRPLDRSELRTIERKTRPRVSSRGQSIATRIQGEGRRALQAELKAARIAKRAPDSSVAQTAVDRAEAALDEADTAALDQHKAHRLAFIYAVCGRAIVGIDVDGSGEYLADKVAGTPYAKHFGAEAYPARWVADYILTPTLTREADAFAKAAADALDAASSAYGAALDAAGAALGDKAVLVVDLADTAAGLRIILAESGKTDDTAPALVKSIAADLEVSADAAEPIVAAAFAQADAQRAAWWRGTTNGAEVMAEVCTHIERLARVGKALTT